MLSFTLVSAAQEQSTSTASGDVSSSAADGADTRVWHHADSLVKKPIYPVDFKHFKWVNPKAPKGGNVRVAALGAFDSLNQFSFKGDAASGLWLVYDSLMASSIDESSTSYGLVAEALTHPDDYSSATFKLRPEARFPRWQTDHP